MALRDQPYLPLYVQDFLTDEKLIECSASATGIYIRLMCIMHKSDEYGVILLKQKDKQNGSSIQNFASKLAKHLPYSEIEIRDGIFELIEYEVLKIEGDKLFQKRMIKDNEISIIRSKAGKKGIFAKAKLQANGIAKAQANTENENENENVIEDIKKINVPFEKFWNLYDKKIDRKKCELKWIRLTDKERIECIEKLPAYIFATPDKKFWRDPETYFNNKSWENEIISPVPVKIEQPKTHAEMLELIKNNPELWNQYKSIKKDGESKAIFIPINQPEKL